MKVFLALICFLAMMLHAVFGFYLYNKGENIFYPEQVQMSLIAQPKEVTTTPPVQPLVSSTTEQTTETTTTPAPVAQDPKPVAEPEPPFEITENFQAPTPKLINPAFNTGWAGFLQVENAVIAFFLMLLGFSVCCVKGRGPASRWVFGFNLVFWSTLTGAVWFFHPVNTPLNIFKVTFKYPQWYFICVLAGIGAVLSLILYLNAFRKPIDEAAKKEAKAAKEKKVNQEPVIAKEEVKEAPVVEEKKVEPAVKPEEKKEKSSRFSFGFGKKQNAKEEKVAPTFEKDIVVPEQKPEAVKAAEPSKEVKVKNLPETKEEKPTSFESFKEELPVVEEDKPVVEEAKPVVEEVKEAAEEVKASETELPIVRDPNTDLPATEPQKEVEAPTIIVPPAPKKEPKL